MILDAQGDIEIVGQAADGREAIELARATDPDVVLIDIRMPVLDGIEATRRLASAGARARILMLTTYGLDEYVYEALRSGATGCCPDPFEARTPRPGPGSGLRL